MRQRRHQQRAAVGQVRALAEAQHGLAQSVVGREGLELGRRQVWQLAQLLLLVMRLLLRALLPFLLLVLLLGGDGQGAPPAAAAAGRLLPQ